MGKIPSREEAWALLTEYNKDDVKTYSIKKLIEEWDGIDGISLTIKQDDDVPADE